MTVARSAAFAVLIAASACLAPLPGLSTVAQAEGSRCTAYQPGSRTPERQQLMRALSAGLNQTAHAGLRFEVKKLWLSCSYARVQLKPKGRRGDSPGVMVDALMLKVNGEWKFDMVADPGGGTPASQFMARHGDIPQVLTYW